jgi:hypothetical protein
MRIIKIDPCAELRKTPSGTHEIGVCDHASAFYVFDTCDVWMAITAMTMASGL